MISSLALAAAESDLWLARVAPVLTAEERKLYLGLEPRARETFQQRFFDGKAVTNDEYFARVTYIDTNFGSGQPGSGANTDQGRLYLALGPPTSIHRVPSSRVFVPTEVWFYDHVPGIGYSSRLQFLFFKQRDTGFPKLYSPQLHTIRALLLPQSSTRGMFPVNDQITANDVLNRLNASPAEQEIVEASLGVARGITGSGNSEILALAASPRAMLRRPLQESARSRVRFVTERPKLNWTVYRDNTVDFFLTARAQHKLTLEVPGVDVFETQLNFETPREVTYSQRLYLLPGTYVVVVDIDGLATHYQVNAAARETDPAAPSAEGLSYRANLYPGAADAALGRQHLRAGRRTQARACFERSLAASRNPDALTGVATLDALAGKLDESRERLLEVLRVQPRHFEALAALAGVSASFQDWPESAKYYRAALAIRPAPALEAALAEVERRR